MDRALDLKSYMMTEQTMMAFVEELKVPILDQSPLKGIGYDPSVVIDGEDKQLLEDETFYKTLKTLGDPSHRMDMSFGGGMLAYELMGVYMAEDMRDIVGVSPQQEGVVYLQYFQDLATYARWWTDNFASDGEDVAPNYMPPMLQPESLVMMLHAIDVYRRVAYQNLLNYETSEEPRVTLGAYLSTMNDAISHNDPRWLLPAFLTQMTMFGELELDINLNQLDPLLQHQIFSVGKEEGVDEPVLIFGEAGRALGVEFYHSWQHASCFSFYQYKENRPKMVDQLFVAPTAVTNHMIKLENNDSNKKMANHQVFTKSMLEYHMVEHFIKALTMIEEEAKNKTSDPMDEVTARTITSEKFCVACGKELGENDLFCMSCGAKVE